MGVFAADAGRRARAGKVRHAHGGEFFDASRHRAETPHASKIQVIRRSKSEFVCVEGIWRRGEPRSSKRGHCS